MMRALWTGASGMISQQTNLDTIANNLANIKTTGYKKEIAEFKTLLYQTVQKKSTNSEGENKPIGVQVGLGVRNSAIYSAFTEGPFEASDGPLDMAIDGNGFFMVQTQDGSTAYTRTGSLTVSPVDSGLMLCTYDGLPILNPSGGQIVFDADTDVTKLQVDSYGNITYPDNNNPVNVGTIGLVQFSNPSGLDKTSGSLYKVTVASGEPRVEGIDTNIKRSKLVTGYLEGSNVQAADEMVNLIITQRAYEMNSKVITASDEMLQQANQLRN